MNSVPAEGLHKDASNLRACPQAWLGFTMVSGGTLILGFVQQ